MTRINCIDIESIPLKMRHAEYREMLRLRKAYPRKSSPNIPPSYRMGKGHVTFFYDKGLYLLKRHAALRKSLKKAGYTVNFKLDLSSWPKEAMNDWTPDTDAKIINISRIINNKVNPVSQRMKMNSLIS
jgi:hypothetical protein